MRIKILAVEIKEVKEGKKDYKLMDVSYKNLEFNKVEGKKIVSFASPDVFQALKDAKPGDEFDVTKGEKSAAGFVPWTRCVSAGAIDRESTNEETRSNSSVGIAQQSTKSTPRSTYETPEERAKKQVLIVRQSSLSSAIAFAQMQGGGSGWPVDNIIGTAKIFEKYVFGSDPVQELIDMHDDIPL